jgi:hypothetical protein
MQLSEDGWCRLSQALRGPLMEAGCVELLVAGGCDVRVVFVGRKHV